MNGKISVVMPAFNSSKYISAAIDSVLIQSYQDFEIVVVDDGSTDDTADVVKSYLSDSRIKYIVQENQGPGAARNRGMQLSSGDYICFLDSDDLMKEGSLKVRHEAFVACPDVMLVFTDYSLKDSGDKYIEKYLCYNDFMSFFNKSVIRRGHSYVSFDDEFINLFFQFSPHPIWTGTVMINRAVVDSIGYFRTDLKVSEDTDLWIRIAEKYKVLFVDEATATYNHCFSSLTVNNTERYCKDVITSLQNVNTATKERRKIIYHKISDTFFSLGYYYYTIDQRKLAVRQYFSGLKYNLKNKKCLKGLGVTLLSMVLAKDFKNSREKQG